MLRFFLILNFSVYILLYLTTTLFNINLSQYLSLNLLDIISWPSTWKIFTFTITHIKLDHLLGNMLFLYFIGRTFENLFNKTRFLIVYLFGGIIGCIFCFISSLFLKQANQLYLFGASASIFAMLFALTCYNPNGKFLLYNFTYIKYKYFAFVVFGLYTFIDLQFNTGGKISHIGGSVFGVLYGLHLKYGFFYRKKTSKNISSEEQLNIFLDKINVVGFENLTNKEKDVLFKISK